MRLLLQRVSRANVAIDGEVTGEIGTGLVMFVGLGPGDSEALFEQASEKILNMRIFPDENGVMNRSVRDADGELLVISQFTLYADVRKGRRPSYIGAMPPAEAETLFGKFFQHLGEKLPGKIAGGRFGAHMDVDLVNDGPVTIWVDSDEMSWKSG